MSYDTRYGGWEAIRHVIYFRDIAGPAKQTFMFDCSMSIYQEFLLESVDIKFQSRHVFVPSITVADFELYIGCAIYIRMPSEVMPISLQEKKLRIIERQNCGINFRCYNVEEEVPFTIMLIGTLYRKTF